VRVRDPSSPVMTSRPIQLSKSVGDFFWVFDHPLSMVYAQISLNFKREWGYGLGGHVRPGLPLSRALALKTRNVY